MKRFPFWIPAHLSSVEKTMLQLRERHAVREAERQVDNAWFRASKAQENRPLDEKRRELNAALTAARAAAREDFRALVMRELQEAAKAKVELPAHITRLAPNENVFRSGVNTTEPSQTQRRLR